MPPSLTISIAMCTYNGERFLEEQLNSLVRQERLPDELVVCDDGSRDATVSILEAFAARSPFPVRLYLNPQNLGYGQNFEKASTFCQGDIIAFSDQDDVWLPHKLARTEEVFRNPNLGYAISDATMVNEQLQPLGYTFWEVIRFTTRQQRRFCRGEAQELFLRDLEIYGVLLAFRANLRDYVFPLPALWSHDGWLPIVLSLMTDFTLISEPLVLYRQHASQYCGMKRVSQIEMVQLARSIDRQYYLKMAQRWRSALECLAADEELPAHKKIMGMIEEKIRHLTVRGQLPGSRWRRLPLVAREVLRGCYFHYSNGWKSVAKDIFMA
jgi:hypothetical protein